MSKLEKMLTAREVAETLQISYKSALRIIKEQLPHIEIAGQYRVHPDHLAAFMYNSTLH